MARRELCHSRSQVDRDKVLLEANSVNADLPREKILQQINEEKLYASLFMMKMVAKQNASDSFGIAERESRLRMLRYGRPKPAIWCHPLVVELFRVWEATAPKVLNVDQNLVLVDFEGLIKNALKRGSLSEKASEIALRALKLIAQVNVERLGKE